MAEWKDLPVSNAQFDKVLQLFAEALVTTNNSLIAALDRNTQALLALATTNAQAANGRISREATSDQIAQRVAENFSRSYRKQF